LESRCASGILAPILLRGWPLFIAENLTIRSYLMNLSAFLRFSPLGILLFALGAVVFASPAFAEGGAEPYLDGSAMGLVWATPFAGILLSIAIVPLVAPHFWHSHFGKISAFWALCFLVPFTIVYGFEISLYEVLHILLL